MKNRFLFTKKQMFLLIGAVLFNFAIYNGGRWISADLYHYNLATSVDLAIPYVNWMVLVYWGCYIFWALNYCFCVKYDPNGYQFILSHFIGETVCFICFVLFPTTMCRATITGTGLFDQLMKLTYTVDHADNLFPSIHCFVSWLCWIGVRNHNKVPRSYKYFSFMMAVLVCICTLLVKQHVLVDVFAGVVLAEASFFFAGQIEQQRYKIALKRLKNV